MKQLNEAQAAQWLLARDRFVLLTHRRPDGDTVGSAAALCRGLRSLGKQAWVLDNTQLTEKYRGCLDGLTISRAPEGACVVSVDVAAENMLALNAGEFAGHVALAIDHHGSNTGFAGAGLVRPDAAACGEIIYELLLQAGVELDRPMAEALYVAVSTDTGCFKYSNVTAHTFTVAAALKQTGADTYPINKRLFETKRFARLKLEAYLTETCAFYAGGKIGVCRIPAAVRDELALTEDDVDDISGFARDIEGVEVAVMLRDIDHDTAKISLRTSPAFDASAICARLGGGGHRAAAGASVPGSLDNAEQAVLRAIRACYPQLEDRS